MIDTFVLVAPIFLLGVIALVGFVGCAQVIGIDDWEPQGGSPPGPPQPPTNLQAIPGDGVVTLLWDPYPHALLFEIDRAIAPPGPPPATYDFLDSVDPAELTITPDGFQAYEDHTVTNGITYHYVVSVTTESGTSEFTGDIEATPTSKFGPFVTDFDGTTVRDGEDRWFGFAFVVGAGPITVHKLGRYYGPSNSGSHDMIIVEAATSQIVGKATVTFASQDVDVKGFKYADLDPPSQVQLNANEEYFVLSLEAANGDNFLDQDTTVTTNGEASVTNGIDSAALVTFTPVGGPGHTYGPLNFQY